MPVANQFTDGSVNSYNSVSLTVTNPTGATYTAAAITCIAETLTINRPYKEIEVDNHLGVPVGAQFTRGRVTATATLQVVPSKEVEAGATFSKDFGLGSENFIIISVGKTYTQNDIQKQNVEIRKVLDSIS